MGDVDNEECYAYMGSEDKWEISVNFPQFCYKTKTLKIVFKRQCGHENIKCSV